MNEMQKTDGKVTQLVKTRHGNQTKYDMEKDTEYRTFSEVWAHVTDVRLNINTTLFFKPKNGDNHTCSIESVIVNKKDIYKKFSEYRKENNVGYKMRSHSGEQDRMFPIDETVTFIKGYLDMVFGEYFKENEIQEDEE